MKKALIVIDMQNDFISGALGSPEARAIVPKVARKIAACAGLGWEIVFTRDTHTQDYLSTQEGKHLPVLHCLKGTPGWELADAIADAANLEGCVVIDKPTFGSLELAQHLQACGPYEEIALVGLVSSICVVSNALIIKAYLPEVRLTVDASCTAGVSGEDYRASLTVMKMCHVNIEG